MNGDNALLNLRSDLHSNIDAYVQQENDSVQQVLLYTVNELVGEDPTEDDTVCEDPANMFITAPVLCSEGELNNKIRSLNYDQRIIFDIICNLANRR